MSDRNRPTSAPTSEPPSPDDAFEVGSTTLDLDNVSDEDLASLSFADETSPGRLLNLQTVSGLTLLLAGTIYLLTKLGALSPSVVSVDAIDPWLVGGAVILLGASLLVWRSSRSSSNPSPSMSLDPTPSQDPNQSSSEKNHLVRSRTDKKLLGVCGGLADYFDLDPTLVRIAFVIGTFFFGSLLLAYFGLAFAMPKAPPTGSNDRPPLPPEAPESDGSR